MLEEKDASESSLFVEKRKKLALSSSKNFAEKSTKTGTRKVVPRVCMWRARNYDEI